MIDLASIANEALSDTLNSADYSERMAIFESLFKSFMDSTRKIPLPDLDARVNDLKDQIKTLALDIKFEVNVQDSSVVITAKGLSDETLSRLTRGTDWFEGRDIGNDILKSMSGTST
jgi:hypothetical protein